MTDEEISTYLNIVRRTITYIRTSALKALKKHMEEKINAKQTQVKAKGLHFQQSRLQLMEIQTPLIQLLIITTVIFQNFQQNIYLMSVEIFTCALMKIYGSV